MVGLKKYFQGEKHLLLLQRTAFLFPEPTWQLMSIGNIAVVPALLQFPVCQANTGYAHKLASKTLKFRKSKLYVF